MATLKQYLEQWFYSHRSWVARCASPVVSRKATVTANPNAENSFVAPCHGWLINESTMGLKVLEIGAPIGTYLSPDSTGYTRIMAPCRQGQSVTVYFEWRSDAEDTTATLSLGFYPRQGDYTSS